MRITVNHIGNIEASLTGLLSAIENGLMDAMKSATVDLQGKFRADTAQARLGTGIANSWRKQLYPYDYGKKSMEPAGFVFSKAAEIIYALSYGVTITARKHVWLAIPLPTAGANPKLRDSSGKFIKSRMSPEIFEQETGLDLQFVSIHGGEYALLVVTGRLVGETRGRKRFGPKDYREAGSITKRQFSAFSHYGGKVVAAPPKRTRTGATSRKGLTTIPVFLLVHSVKLPKLFDLEGRADAAQNALAASVATAVAVAVVPNLRKI